MPVMYLVVCRAGTNYYLSNALLDEPCKMNHNVNDYVVPRHSFSSAPGMQSAYFTLPSTPQHSNHQ